MIEEKLKPFDYAAYLAGKPVRTRDGRKVLELYLAKTSKARHPLAVWLDDGQCFALTAEGKFGGAGSAECHADLFMDTVKKSVWLNIFRATSGSFFCTTRLTQELADSHAEKYSHKFIKTIEVEYEE